MGKPIVEWSASELDSDSDDAAIFDRQALVVSDQAGLSHARVAVVGLCGGGSHVVQQLAHSGVGTIIGVDADTCEPTNLHRMVGMRSKDGARRSKKIEVMKRLVRSIGTRAEFVGVDARVPQPKAVDALKSADVIVGTIGNLHARADLQEIAWRNVIPYIDIGKNALSVRRSRIPSHTSISSWAKPCPSGRSVTVSGALPARLKIIESG